VAVVVAVAVAVHFKVIVLVFKQHYLVNMNSPSWLAFRLMCSACV